MNLKKMLVTVVKTLVTVGIFVSLRVSREQEMEGLDITQHGEALQ